MTDTPKPRLQLIGRSGNAFAILGQAKRALEQAGREDETERFLQQATSGNYLHLLSVVMEWFEVE